MDKPEEIPRLKYYTDIILTPFNNLWDRVADRCKKIYRKLSGRWYCENCFKYHGRRVKKYMLIHTPAFTITCSLALHDKRRANKRDLMGTDRWKEGPR